MNAAISKGSEVSVSVSDGNPPVIYYSTCDIDMNSQYSAWNRMHTAPFQPATFLGWLLGKGLLVTETVPPVAFTLTIAPSGITVR